MITVVNLKDKPYPDFDLYIGRENKWLFLKESKWHNPIPLKKESDRELVLYEYFNYIIKQKDLLNDLYELDDKVLGCYCKPKLCHSTVLIFLRDLQKLDMLNEFLLEYNLILEEDKFKYIINILKEKNNENIKNKE
jgi:hypothetical protein